MNKIKGLRTIILIMTFALIVCVATNVFAEQLDLGDMNDTNENIPTLDNTLTGGNNTTDGNTTGGNSTTDGNTAGENNTTDGNVAGENNTTNGNTAVNNSSSQYQENDIPHAGVESTALIISSFVVCAIIGIYTFMKLSDYSNI